MRSAKTAIGVAITLGALTSAGDAPLDDLLLGDEAVAVYDPLDPSSKLKRPGSVTDELSAALETLAAARGVALPLTLFEVGYPAAEAAGSSESDQNAYYEALFQALSVRRDALGFVGVFGLDDRAPADCADEAAQFGGGTRAKAARALVRCSMGLRAETDQAGQTAAARPVDRPAWSTVLAAFSRYR